MLRKSFLAACLLSATLGFAHCQSLSEIKPLTIGDTLPDITLHHLLRYGSDSLRTGSLRGKVVVLDFFMTWCSTCIEALPHLDSLQQHFGNQMQALVIDYEPLHIVDSFAHRNKKVASTHLPIVTDDKILAKMFPHTSNPHEIILDGAGRVQAITHFYNLTRPVIQDVIDGKTLHFTVKKEMTDYSMLKPLFYYGNGGDLNPASIESAFCPYMDGLPNFLHHRFRDSIHTRYLFDNESIVTLYRAAVYPWLKWKYNRMVLEVHDSSSYTDPRTIPASNAGDQWMRKNLYTYELTAPANTPDSVMRQYMLEDLNRNLHINGRFERRMTNCWVLVRTTAGDALFRSKGARQDMQGYRFINEPFSTLLNFLNYPNGPIVVDETGYTGGVDIDLNGVKSLQDLSAVRKALQPYGLDLVHTRRMLKMLVLTEDDLNAKLRRGETPPAKPAVPSSSRLADN